MNFRLRLSHRIYSIAALGMGGLFVLGGLYLMGNASQKLARDENESARSLGDMQNKIFVGFLELRRAEKDFLLRKDEKYIQLHEQASKQVASDLGEMRRRTATSGRNDLNQKLDSIQAGYEGYQQHFAGLSGARIKLGLKEDLGLEGSLRTSVHEIETALKAFDAPALMVTMLMMRRHEKDFMLRGEAKSGDDMKKRATEFSSQVAEANMPATAKADLMQKLANYQRDFFAWMATAQLVATEQMAVSQSFAAMEPVIDSVAQAIRQLAEDAGTAEISSRESTALRMEIAIAAIVCCVGLLALLIARGVVGPLSRLTSGMNELADGNFDVVLPGLDRKDEVGEMAQAVETFKVNAERKARDEAEEQAANRDLLTRRQEEIDQLIGFFGRSMSGSFKSLSVTSADMSQTSASLESAAQTTGSQAVQVLGEVRQTSLNIQTVAAASQQLSASISEIGRQASESARGSTQAMQQAEAVVAKVDELRQAAEEIGNVVKLINSIAGQTNLLGAQCHHRGGARWRGRPRLRRRGRRGQGAGRADRQGHQRHRPAGRLDPGRDRRRRRRDPGNLRHHPRRQRDRGGDRHRGGAAGRRDPGNRAQHRVGDGQRRQHDPQHAAGAGRCRCDQRQRRRGQANHRGAVGRYRHPEHGGAWTSWLRCGTSARAGSCERSTSFFRLPWPWAGKASPAGC